MNSLEIQYLFEERARTIDKLQDKVFTTLEIETFVNEAIDNFMVNNIASFEKNEKSRLALSQLVATSSLVVDPGATDVLNDNSVVYTLPTGTLAVVEAQADIRYNESGAGTDDTILVKPITHDQYIKNIKNPYKKPYRLLMWRLDYGGQHEIITDGTYTIIDYQIRYVSTPTAIDIDSNTTPEINDIDIYEIVTNALQYALQSLATERVIGDRMPDNPDNTDTTVND